MSDPTFRRQLDAVFVLHRGALQVLADADRAAIAWPCPACKKTGRHPLLPQRTDALGATAPGDHMSTQIDMDAERERMAAIGRAVVEYLRPGDERAARQATPDAVVAELRRLDEERIGLETCTALRVGRLVVGAYSALTSKETT